LMIAATFGMKKASTAFTTSTSELSESSFSHLDS